jgi:hypothetical protein
MPRESRCQDAHSGCYLTALLQRQRVGVREPRHSGRQIVGQFERQSHPRRDVIVIA